MIHAFRGSGGIRTHLVLGFRAYILLSIIYDFCLDIGIFCSSDRGSYHLLSAAGQEARVNTGCNCMPWPRSVPHALGVQSSGNYKITTGRHSEQVEPSRPMQTHLHEAKNVRTFWGSVRIVCQSATTARTVHVLHQPLCVPLSRFDARHSATTASTTTSSTSRDTERKLRAPAAAAVFQGLPIA